MLQTIIQNPEGNSTSAAKTHIGSLRLKGWITSTEWKSFQAQSKPVKKQITILGKRSITEPHTSFNVEILNQQKHSLLALDALLYKDALRKLLPSHKGKCVISNVLQLGSQKS